MRHSLAETIGSFFMNPAMPEPNGSAAVEPEPINRRSVLLAEIRALDRELADHDAAMASFRSKNMVGVNGVLAFLHPRGTDTGRTRERIETEWRTLLERRDEIQRERNKTLQELSRYAA